MNTITVIICARNAELFVGRAVRSAFSTGASKVLLVDDYSDDGTVEEAQAASWGGVEVVRPIERKGLGNARLVGIEKVDTEYAMWLDADDELLPGRLERMLASLRGGADLVFDSAELCDGETGKKIKDLRIPEFMYDVCGLYRIFERNYLPGPAWPALRVEMARKVGYDPEQNACEDSDFLMRALRNGAKWELLREVGYRQFDYPTSLSRDLTHQRRYLARALSKHKYGDLEAFLGNRGVAMELASWWLCSNSLFRGDWNAADGYSRCAFSASGEVAQKIVEPWGVEFEWLSSFVRGTIMLLSDREGGMELLQRCVEWEASADAFNNLGIALVREGEFWEARECFNKALELLPGYLDARRNLELGEAAANITTHPLRRFESRSFYHSK